MESFIPWVMISVNVGVADEVVVADVASMMDL